jgi:hypothetical protein
MKNLRAPRTIADCDFTTGYPSIIPTRRARLIETVAGGAVILALILFIAYVVTRG